MPDPTTHLKPDDAAVQWRSLVEATAATDYTLTAPLLAELTRTLATMPADLPGKAEFILPLDAAGQPAASPPEAVAALCHALRDTPRLHQWLSIVDHGGHTSILVVRPLCHRIGLRHGTIQIILDHPTRPDYTLIQVRGYDKADAPGAFDMPCAGHVVGCDTDEVTLKKELAEELGLTCEDLEGIRDVGRYQHHEATSRDDFINVELRTVYRAQLRSCSLDRIHFADSEVAALAIYSLKALNKLIARFPDRIASGLRGSLPWYAA